MMMITSTPITPAISCMVMPPKTRSSTTDERFDGDAILTFDNDNYLDLYITNIHDKGKHNRLYRNDTADGVPQGSGDTGNTCSSTIKASGASTFADPEIVHLLKTRFVPVAIDQAYQRRQQDTEGDFYRKLTSQSPRNNPNSTTQGFYVATAGGDLLLYNNNRDPEKVLRLMKQALHEFAAMPESSAPQQAQIRAALEAAGV